MSIEGMGVEEEVTLSGLTESDVECKGFLTYDKVVSGVDNKCNKHKNILQSPALGSDYCWAAPHLHWLVWQELVQEEPHQCQLEG
jgi:hypothetical protein